MPITFNGVPLNYTPADLSLRVLERDMVIFNERTGHYPTILGVESNLKQTADQINTQFNIGLHVEVCEETGFTLTDDEYVNVLREWW